MKRAGFFFLAAAFIVAGISLRASAQTTYTWNQAGSAAWTTSANWTPTRTTPAVDDVLVFNNAATTTATGVPTQTIGQLSISGNTNVTLQAGATATVTIAGGAGTDLSVGAGSQLNVNTATAVTINVATGATGSISGSMTLSAGAHRLTAIDASGITFNSGATFTEGTAFSGNPFGTTNLNSIVFASGSTFVFIAGSNPFGAGQPSSCVVFQSGSLFSHQSSATPGFSGRTYANFELNIPATTITVTGGSAVSINDLTVTAGTLNFNMTGTPGHSIKGNISVAGTLNFNPLTAGTVNLNGTSAQGISGAGTITSSSLQTVNMNNASGLTLFRSLTLGGPLTLTSGNISTSVANTLAIAASGSVSRTSGHIIGNLQKTFTAAANRTFEVGTPGAYSPVGVNATSGTFPADFTVRATAARQSNVNVGTSLLRYWTLNASGITADLTFNYLAGDVEGVEANYKVIRVIGGTPVSFPTSTVDAINHIGTLNGATVFTAEWTLGEPLPPTAGSSRISGFVTRADGQPLGGVTVNLSGSQSARTITDANGQYRFSDVDTNSFYTVTPGLANYSFSPSSRSFALLGNRTDAGFTASADGTQTENPLNFGDFFVRQQYLDFLGREPDQQGWLFWTEQLNQCGIDANCIRQKRIDISAAFFQSDEFQLGGNYVYRLYRAALGRRLTYAEFSEDRQQVVGGPGLDASRIAFADSFVGRPEFVQKYQNISSGEVFVDALLQTVQQDAGLELSSQREALIQTYNGGADTNQSRSAVLRAVAESSAFKGAVYNASFVLTEYFGYLQRGPDADGYNFWVEVLNHRDPGNYRGMVCSFLTSAEYQQRFSSVVVHGNNECGR
jgi:hypothetical protein